MEQIPVNSTNIESVGYDEDSQTLQIEFLNGGIYQYFDVPEIVFIGIRDADSVGRYFASNIKGSFRYSRV